MQPVWGPVSTGWGSRAIVSPWIQSQEFPPVWFANPDTWPQQGKQQGGRSRGKLVGMNRGTHTHTYMHTSQPALHMHNSQPALCTLRTYSSHHNHRRVRLHGGHVGGAHVVQGAGLAAVAGPGKVDEAPKVAGAGALAPSRVVKHPKRREARIAQEHARDLLHKRAVGDDQDAPLPPRANQLPELRTPGPHALQQPRFQQHPQHKTTTMCDGNTAPTGVRNCG